MSPDPIGGPLLFQLVLILINAYFASTEIAVLSMNDVKLRHQAEEGDKMAVMLLKLADNPNRFLSTIQVGITLAGFLGSAFAAENFANRLATAILNAGAADRPSTADHAVRHPDYADPVLLHAGAGRAGAQAHRHAAAGNGGADERPSDPRAGGDLSARLYGC